MKSQTLLIVGFDGNLFTFKNLLIIWYLHFHLEFSINLVLGYSWWKTFPWLNCGSPELSEGVSWEAFFQSYFYMGNLGYPKMYPMLVDEFNRNGWRILLGRTFKAGRNLKMSAFQGFTKKVPQWRALIVRLVMLAWFFIVIIYSMVLLLFLNHKGRAAFCPF